MKQIDAAGPLSEYNTGKFTIEQIATKYGVSTGKMYYLLRDAGCKFITKRRKPFSEEERRQRSKIRKGKHLTEEQKRLLSEKNSCNYNGMNGYGHTKRHNRGYILAYAPKHPHAHKDGYLMLHTVLMEQHIGRYLRSDEVVHHVNHNREDNRLENLMLMKKHDHHSLHMRERHEKKEE